MTEDYLQYVWHFRLFNRPLLRTTHGEEVEVLSPGQWNRNSGPDFLDARIRIGDKVWAGHVEVHVKSSDWHQHGHQNDPAYHNMVLHVVLHHDADVNLQQPGDLPVLELAPYLIAEQYARYAQWMQSRTWIPCQTQLPELDGITWRNWLDRLAVERLERKTAEVMNLFKLSGNDWSETLYRRLAWNFGFKTNSDAFAELATRVPLKALAFHRSDPFQVEALLFGTAGMLQGAFADEYPQRLQREFSFLQKKYSLQPMNTGLWKWARMRPAGFPTVRIAQFAALVCRSQHLFPALLGYNEAERLRELFEVSASEYWVSRSSFRPASGRSENELFDTDTALPTNPGRIERRLGHTAIDNILINTVSVVLFAYGRHRGEERFTELALRVLENCKPEDNHIIKNWSKLGRNSQNAMDSQAQIQLYNHYCSRHQCLRCQIGTKLLRN